MNKDNLRDLLAQPYKIENWKKVVDFVFPNVSYLQRPVTIPSDDKLVESFRQVGSVQLNDGKNLALFEVNVKPNVNIARNRVALRNLVAKYIDQERNHGVLAIYEKGTDEYRFTYTAKETDYDEEKGDFVVKETQAKRFTYILGANESCRTARDRFWELSQNKEEATIKEVENAFSVEKLSKEFFTKYKIQYTAFVDYLCQSNYKISAFNADEKSIRDFVKKMLGRIVFLHFVQKKGWLGASNSEYNDGDKQFMYQLWQNSKKDEAFYQLVLAPLFFDALNQNHRTDDAFTFPDESILRIPYLGGGLFEKDREDPEFLTFPSTLFENLFSFFYEYNFTIDENDPHENEVGIDPEMLGQIFENLLEDNKDKGAFYTPKPIVKYMCQESLIQYLLTSFEKEGIVTDDLEKQDFEEKLGHLVKKYEAHEVIENDRILAKALYHVKICDPAIGSGAFPMGILNEMVMLINVLHSASPDVVEDLWKMDNWQPATIKKHIIQNSIYGVDIEKGAVDIARLRFWLSLIIDEEKPCNLPSLDYKIVVGNSLISKFEDEIIDIDWEVKEEDIQGNLFGDENEKARQKLLKNISQKQIAFYAAENHQKEKLELEIRNLKIDLLINQLQLQIKKKGMEKVPELSRGNVLKNQTEQYLKTQGWKQTITKLENLKKHPEKPFQHFDWRLDFPEVLNPEIAGESTGFDIVIGNPPYIRVENVSDEYVRLYKKVYESSTGKFDISFLFLEKGIQLIKRNSTLMYITSYQFLYAGSGIGLRKFLSKYVSSNIVMFSSENQVFESATTYTGIIKCLKTNSNRKHVIIKADYSKPFIKYKNIIEIDENNFIAKKVIVSDTSLFEKIIGGSDIKFGKELGYAKCGVVSSADDVFFIDEKKVLEFKLETELLYPILGSESLNRWYLDEPTFYCIYPYTIIDGKTNLVSEDELKFKFPNVWNYLQINKTRLIGRSQGRVTYELSDKWYQLNRPREKWIYDSQKIIYSGTTNAPKFAIDSKGIVFRNARLYAYISIDFNDYIYLTCILNSKLSGYLMSIKCPPKNNNYYELSTDFTETFPFKYKIDKISDFNIIYAKLINEITNDEIGQLESQIDIMVYKLYELTYDEVLVVDPGFALSEQEYNDFSMEDADNRDAEII